MNLIDYQARLQRDGRWGKFQAYRNALMSFGIPAAAAMKRSQEAFPPDDPRVAPLPPEINPHPGDLPKPPPPPDYDAELAAAFMRGGQNPAASRAVGSAEAGDEKDLIQRLAVGAKHKRASPRATVAWVHQNMLVPACEIDADKVPDSGAVGMWNWARDNPDEFYKTIFTRTMPSKAQVDADEDGRGKNLKIDRVFATFERALSEGVSSGVKLAEMMSPDLEDMVEVSDEQE